MSNSGVSSGGGSTVVRDQVRLAGLGLIAETAPLLSAEDTAGISSTRWSGVAIPLLTTDTIHNMVMYTRTAPTGAAPTALVLGIARPSDGIVLAQTADLSADAQWSAVRTAGVFPLTAQFVPPANGDYYAVVWINGAWATVQVALACNSPVTSVGNAIGAAPPAVATGTMAAFPANGAALSAASSPTNTTPFWFGVT